MKRFLPVVEKAFETGEQKARAAFESYQSPNVIIDVLISWGTTNFSSTRVEEKERLSLLT